MEPMVIEVHGVPSISSHDRMTDQLKIHFLKRKNSGGDVLMVIYPTSTPGQAYVIFESAEVPEVLAWKHILEVDNRFYPIGVKKAHLSEVDMPVETSLDLSMFPKQEKTVSKLLKYYGFNVKDIKSGHVQLHGSFLKLKLLRSKLMQLQGHEHQSHERSPTTLHNGSTLGYGMERNSVDHRYGSKSVSRNDAVSWLDSAPSSLSSLNIYPAVYESSRIHQNSLLSYTERNTSSPVDGVAQKYHERHNHNELLAQRQSPIGDGASSSISANYSSDLTLLHHTSPLNIDLASSGSPRSLQSSYSSTFGSTSYASDTGITKYTQQEQHVIGNAMVTHRASPLVDVPSPSKNSTSSPNMQHHTNSRDSASGGSFRRRSSFDRDTGASSSSSSPSSSSEGKTSFPVDTEIIDFILTQEPDVVKRIQNACGTEMSLKYDAGFTMVTFLGKNSEEAKAYLLETIKKIGPLLRTQVIELKKFDRSEQKKILQRIEFNKDLGVTITPSDDCVKIVGYSNLSFEVMQKILGNNDDRGRAMGRNSKLRRSSSLPRQFKSTPQSRSTGPEYQAGAPKTYSPSHYQEKSDEGKASQVVRGREQTPDRNPQHTRSNSASRDKSKISKERSMHQDVELTTPNQVKKSMDFIKLHDLKSRSIFCKGFNIRKK
ncbi:RNA-binding protein 43 isoform 1-T3 [Clarias gariepinus]|uniref:uncharacterized protein si:dkey-154b15.1 n=1 Tax=Clarias gariepinus TaxID=13013 RepID=UPI00234C8FFB|nr:uncharacterized protein si:dkey-154b15.1 [Clarias gariepinus]XP_053345865.1 uncharacterized protein si:dkey-154b15.1 [Clarias gariepinus]